jgi:hypothetical protein
VPDAIEASSNAAQWIHERISAPDGENGILLTESLCGTDNFIFSFAAKVLAQPSA